MSTDTPPRSRSDRAPGEQDETDDLEARTSPGELSERVRAAARELGFRRVGIAPPAASEHGAFYRGWLGEGRHGEMSYLARPDAVERREDLGRTLPDVRSVIVVAHDYFLEDAEGVPDDPSRGVIARYARGRDYHRVVEKKLRKLHRRIGEIAGRDVAGRPYVDTGPILERELGKRAGLGWFGKNTMLIDPRGGSYFFLGCLLVELELEADEPFTEDRCGTCHACVDACPTGALLGRDEDGAPVLDARRCISYLTIENRGAIPRDLRPLIGNRVYGCDICQEVCPFNRKFAEPSDDPSFAARGPGEPPVGVEPDPSHGEVSHPGTDSPSLIELMSMDEESWDAFSRGSAIRRAGRDGFMRNVAVALGNWGSSSAVPALAAALRRESSLVRGHSAWALGEVGTDEARSVLLERLDIEEDSFVRTELEQALEA